jgi:drug/metabolite transporter (DMT)-like permease
VPTTALVLVLVAAVLHAGWNLGLKRSGASGIRFFWLVTVIETLLMVPIALTQCAAQDYVPPAESYLRMAGSAVVHVAYFLFLGYGYRSGALSVVYPLARATGPMLTIVVATIGLGERPTAVAVGGAVAIGLGALMLSGNPLAIGRNGGARGIGFALATGAMIAIYTIWDRMAVHDLQVPPMIYYGGSLVIRCLLMAPLALRDPALVREEWRLQRKTTWLVGILSPASYVLVLFAMQMAPLSYVAPAREISILFGAVIGTQLLREGETVRRLSAAAVMLAGLVAIALAGK